MFKIYTLVSVICSPLLTDCVDVTHKKYFYKNQDCNNAAQNINLRIIYPGTKINNYCKEKYIWQV